MSAPSFLPELKLSQLRTHEKNPRRKAIADPDMIASVKASGLLQPLVVAPTGDDDVPYVLIDGHRRHHALRKARATTAPAVVRHDLVKEGDQVQAMVLASLYREDLSPLEQAEGFEQLRTMKWTQARISESTGVPVATVRDRLKLLKLSKPTQAKIHKGQLTLTDALDLVAFDDDPETQAKLVKAAGTYNWSYELQRAKRQRKAIAHADEIEAQLLGQGVTKVDTAPGANWYGDVRDRENGPIEIEATHSMEAADHANCYAFVRTSEYTGDPVIKMVCTNPGSHDITETDLERERREERERWEADRKAEIERQGLARDLRVKAVMKVADELTLPAPVVDLLRSLLPHLVWNLSGVASEVHQDLAGVPRRGNHPAWPGFGAWRQKADLKAFEEHAAALTFATPVVLTARLTAVLVGTAEATTSTGYNSAANGPLVERYYELLEQLDHHRGDVDDEILAAHRGEDQSAEATA